MTNQVATFDQAVALTGKKAIDFFSNPENIQPLIEQVKTEALSLVPDVKTKKGRDAIGSTALKVSKSRKAITEAIDKSVADLKSKVAAATAVKKLVAEELGQVREEVLAPRNEWQAEQDRIEQERVDSIKAKIAELAALGEFTTEETKEQLADKIDALENVDVSEFFQEFTADAAKAVQESIANINARILKIIEEAKAEEQRERLEAEQLKNKIQEKISNLVQIPLQFMGKSSRDIKAKITELENFTVPESLFGDRTDEAEESMSQVISQLKMMYDQKVQLESIANSGATPQPDKHDRHDDLEPATSKSIGLAVVDTTMPDSLIAELANWGDKFDVSIPEMEALEVILNKYF